MKKKFIIATLLMMGFSYCYSQNLSPTIISSQGSFDQIESMTIEWTLGENFVETVIQKNNVFTQGFLQPFIKNTFKKPPFSDTFTSLDIRIAPNPVHTQFSIILHPNLNFPYHFRIYDGLGRIIKKTDFINDDFRPSIDISNLSSGVYYLHTFDSNGVLLKINKIIKN
jgi:hypothetical protein